jgi:hypothetical protein
MMIMASQGNACEAARRMGVLLASLMIGALATRRSDSGTKRTFGRSRRDVCFGRKADMRNQRMGCLLMTQSGHPLRLIGIRTIISKQSRAEDAPSELLQGRSVIGTRGLLDPITHQPQAKTQLRPSQQRAIRVLRWTGPLPSAPGP